MSAETNTTAASTTNQPATKQKSKKISWTTGVLMVLAGVSATAVAVTNALYIAYDAGLSPSDDKYNSYGYPGYRTVFRVIAIIAYFANMFGLIFDNKYHIKNRGTCKAYGIMRIGIAVGVACMIVTDPLSEMSWQDVQLRDNVDGSVALEITLPLIGATVLWILIVRCFRWNPAEFKKA